MIIDLFFTINVCNNILCAFRILTIQITSSVAEMRSTKVSFRRQIVIGYVITAIIFLCSVGWFIYGISELFGSADNPYIKTEKGIQTFGLINDLLFGPAILCLCVYFYFLMRTINQYISDTLP